MVLKLYRAGLTNNQNSLASVGKETRIQYILTSLWLKAVDRYCPYFLFKSGINLPKEKVRMEI